MNKESVVYERDIHASYMKVPALLKNNLDEKIMLKRQIKGMIPVERCYINGEGQYWYNISGKQALDSFIKVHMLEYSMFERLLLRICEQLETLEWNLLDGNGMLVDPEFIFLNSNGEDISFVFYPETNQSILMELQKLMEYLLTKLNHTDTEVVQGAYEFYEVVSNENYQIKDLKEAILERRIRENYADGIKTKVEGAVVAEKAVIYGEEVGYVEPKKEGFQAQIEEKISALCKRAKEILVRNPKEEIPTVVYPKEDEKRRETIHPTICIAATLGETKGILLYEGMGGYLDFELDKRVCIIGKSPQAHM